MKIRINTRNNCRNLYGLKFISNKKININLFNKTVKFLGIVKKIRKHGKITFIDLSYYRENQELISIQTVWTGDFIKKNIKIFDLVIASGIMQNRPIKLQNLNQYNGKIEIKLDKIAKYIHSNHKKPLFNFLDNIDHVNREIGNQYRFLWLRNTRMQKWLKIKSDLYYYSKIFFHKRGFIEINTPILTKDSKEGSRSFLTPSRLHSYKQNFALSQSPQIYKQALMSSYIGKYFQFASTFRDEDVRSDRQPEFEQLDVEIITDSTNEIQKLVEDWTIFILSKLLKIKIPKFRFPSLKYRDAINFFNSDEPKIEFYFSEKNQYFLSKTLKLNKKEQQKLFSDANYPMYWITKDKKMFNEIIEKYLFKIDGKYCHFCWINDFPMFKISEEKKIKNFRHIFSRPKCKINTLLKKKSNNLKWLKELKSYSYDLIFDGREVLSGSLRNNRGDVQEFVVDKIHDINKKEFQFFIEMLKFDVPIHGGFALGIERFLYKILNTKTINDFIAFPKNDKFECCLTKAPK